MRKCRISMALWMVVALVCMGCGTDAKHTAQYELGKATEAAMVLQEDTTEASSQIMDEDLAALTQMQETEPESEQEVTILMVGDVLLHDRVEEACKRADGSYQYSALFADMKDCIAQADLAFVNQEVILGGKELGISGYPAFNADFTLGDALVEAGFDVILHGTNHALDKGGRGLRNCLAFWQENYPDTAVLGIHSSAKSQDTIYVQECKGIRIAILNYTYGTNGIPLPEDMPFGVDYLEENRVKEDLKKARELADFVIVCPHWGTEYKLEESSSQRKWASFMAENGADLIMGTHPHVIEPIAWVGEAGITKLDLIGEGYDGSRLQGEEFVQDALAHRGDTLVYYSLGNFLNWTSGAHEGVADRMVGGMSHVTIAKDEEGKAYIKEYGIAPVVAHLEKGQDQVRVYPLEAYTSELASRNEIIKQDSSFSREYCLKLCTDVW